MGGYLKYLIILFLVLGVAYGLKQVDLLYQVPEDEKFMGTAVKPKSLKILYKVDTADDLARGSIVVFFHPVTEKELLARVVALPGDRLEVSAEGMLLNGEPYQDSYGQEDPRHPTRMAAIRVPDHHVVVLNDVRKEARSAMADSRTLGPVHLSALKGRLEE